MVKEIEVLLQADRQGCLIVDKNFHALLEREELEEAKGAGLYQEEVVFSQDASIEVSGPYPGCPQLGAATKDDVDYRQLGQTQHFVIFLPARARSALPNNAVPEVVPNL